MQDVRNQEDKQIIADHYAIASPLSKEQETRIVGIYKRASLYAFFIKLIAPFSDVQFEYYHPDYLN
jgi:hypothetical protein